MPITDSDIVEVRSVSRQGQNSITMNIVWKDGVTGVTNGSFTVGWDNFDQLKESLETQGLDDIMRAIAGFLINRNTGAFRGVLFDGMPGNSYRVNQNVSRVV